MLITPISESKITIELEKGEDHIVLSSDREYMEVQEALVQNGLLMNRLESANKLKELLLKELKRTSKELAELKEKQGQAIHNIEIAKHSIMGFLGQPWRLNRTCMSDPWYMQVITYFKQLEYDLGITGQKSL